MVANLEPGKGQKQAPTQERKDLLEFSESFPVESLRVSHSVRKEAPGESREDKTPFAELVKSIRERGILVPLILSDAGDVLDGRRRLAAAQRLKFKTVPVIIRNENSASGRLVELVTNMHRLDLTGLEKARAYKAYIDETSCTQAELAKMIGRSPATVSETLSLLELPKGSLDALEAGLIEENAAAKAAHADVKARSKALRAEASKAKRDKAAKAGKSVRGAKPKKEPRVVTVPLTELPDGVYEVTIWENHAKVSFDIAWTAKRGPEKKHMVSAATRLASEVTSIIRAKLKG